MGPHVQCPPTKRHLIYLFSSLCGCPVVPDHKEKSGRGRVARLRQGQVPQPPNGPGPGSQLPPSQLPSSCGGNRNNAGTLIRLINSLCSRVVAIRPAVWAALGAGQGSLRLLAPCLPSPC